MALDLCDYEQRTRDAVQHFWKTRKAAADSQVASGKSDQGTRGSVTAGKHMDGFCRLFVDLAKANGLPSEAIVTRGRLLTLPGFFRPAKNWDLILMNDGHLIAALEFKSTLDRVDPFACITEAISDAVNLTARQRRSWQHMPRPPFVGFVFTTATALHAELDASCAKLIQQRICDGASAIAYGAEVTNRHGDLVAGFASRCAEAAGLRSRHAASLL